MNLLLLEDEDFLATPSASGRVRVTGERLEHLRAVLRAEEGDRVQVGRLDGLVGQGRIASLDRERAILDVTLDRPPPPPLEVELVLALPRPPMLRRLLQAVTSLGVKRITLLHTARVEKSYWQSAVLEPASIGRLLRLGLAQAGDTVLPTVEERRRFRPFAEDELPQRLRERTALVADPGFEQPCPTGVEGPTLLVVGPEGGFVPFELGRLLEAGARGVGLGPRILRVETAVVALLARLAA